ncbi:Alpha/beta hydrolase of unknown function [Cognatiyoonia koreensis]|uniref:Alpha/beta hydrolase family protein n=1 Tax=Cognatiyoonia koreensis TaxID=364200 RepID=A0A1I0S034_9RHOB|nr:alpha/beta fold hydrolase [Cognatiyoonia koreensis]SEW47418.1 Alpha/beta hydrolase of unknown function [Cognatiyoonia koreensis]
MDYFYSRRTFNSQTGRFSNNVASVTRYVGIGPSDGQAARGHLLTAQQWAKAVHDQSPNGHVVVYVHGFNTAQSTMLKSLATIKAGLKKQAFKGAVAAFDWPSDGEGSSAGYRRDRSDAKAVARHMVLDGIKLLHEAKPSAKIHLLAHSMGAYVSLRGWGEVGNAFFPGKVDQAIFVAADADQNWMINGAWGSLVMQQRCNRLTHYFSAHDEVLDVSGKIVNFGTSRSGRHGIKPGPAPTFRDVSCGDRYHSVFPQHKRGTTLSHNWYFQDGRFYQDLVGTLAGKSHTALGTRQNLSDGDQRITP